MYLEFTALKICVCALVYMCILKHEKPFNKWFLFGWRHFGKTLLYKPFFECEKCFAGQVAAWFYIVTKLKVSSGGKWFFYVQNCGYNLAEHLYFICLTILITFVAAKIFAKMDK